MTQAKGIPSPTDSSPAISVAPAIRVTTPTDSSQEPFQEEASRAPIPTGYAPPPTSQLSIARSEPAQTTTADHSQRSTVPELPNPHAGADISQSLVVLYAAIVSDMEHLRMATNQRFTQFEKLHLDNELESVRAIADQIEQVETQAIKNLEKAMKKHKLGPYAARTIGIGYKQFGRLLAAIGDPGTRQTVSQLWAYCGMHVVDGHAPRNKSGQQSNWNNEARTRIRLISESCIKQRHSPYRAVYDAGREKYNDLELTDGHKHNRALRLVAKEILKDIWRESRGNDGEGTTVGEVSTPHKSATGSST